MLESTVSINSIDCNTFYNQQREFYIQFLQSTDQKKVLAKHMATILPLYLQDLIESFSWFNSAEFLTMGAGAGEEIIELMSSFREQNVRLSIEEPNISVLSWLLFDYMLNGLNISKLRQHQPGDSYHFIAANHLFYYVDPVEKLEEIISMLLPEGVACISLTSEEGAMYKLRKEFFPEIGHNTPFSGEQLINIMRNEGIALDSYKIRSNLYMIDGLTRFGSGDNNIIRTNLKLDYLYNCTSTFSEIDRLLSFILRTDFTQLDDSLQADINETVRSLSNGNIFPLTDLAIWFSVNGQDSFEFEKGYQNHPRNFNIISEVTINDIYNFLKPTMDSTFGQDLASMHPEVRTSYEKSLVVEMFLSHPKFERFVDQNCSDIDTDNIPWDYQANEKLGLGDLVLFPSNEPDKFTRNYHRIYGCGGEIGYFNWYLHALNSEYKKFSEEVKSELKSNEWGFFVFDMHKKFRHVDLMCPENRSAFWWEHTDRPDALHYIGYNNTERFKEILNWSQTETT